METTVNLVKLLNAEFAYETTLLVLNKPIGKLNSPQECSNCLKLVNLNLIIKGDYNHG